METNLMGQVRSLLEKAGPTTARNTNYESFASQEGQRVFRLFRLYTSVLAEVEQAAQDPDFRVTAARETEGLRLVLENKRVSYRRITMIPPELEAAFLRRLQDLGLA